MHLTLMGTNTQCVINLLGEIFSDSPTDSDLEELEEPVVKRSQAKAATARATDAQASGEHDPSKETKYVTMVGDMTPVDYGFDPKLVPQVLDVIVIDADGSESTKIYYQC